MNGALAVALHDVEPCSFSRVLQIREWLAERGVDRATLLVIPAPDRHPIGDAGPALAGWIRGRVARGDAIAQHGLTHQATAGASWVGGPWLRRWQGGDALEFPGLDPAAIAGRVGLGTRLLAAIELEPRGFIAPGYAYTRALRSTLAESFDWFADLRRVHTPTGPLKAPALCLGSSTGLKQKLSPTVVRAIARISDRTLMRLDVHPADFEFPAHVEALESLLELAGRRPCVTYDELVA